MQIEFYVLIESEFSIVCSILDFLHVCFSYIMDNSISECFLIWDSMITCYLFSHGFFISHAHLCSRRFMSFFIYFASSLNVL